MHKFDLIWVSTLLHVFVCMRAQASAAGVTAAMELVRFVIFDIHPLRLYASFRIDKQVCVCVCVCVITHIHSCDVDVQN